MVLVKTDPPIFLFLVVKTTENPNQTLVVDKDTCCTDYLVNYGQRNNPILQLIFAFGAMIMHRYLFLFMALSVTKCLS